MQNNRSFLCGSPLDDQLPAQASAVKADLVHFDLASSVPQSQKANARAALREHYAEGFEIPSAIRINCLECRDGSLDLRFLADRQISPGILIIPKVKDLIQTEEVRKTLEQHDGSIKIFAVVENSRFLTSLETLTETPESLAGLIFGAVDFCADAGIPLSHAATRPARFEMARIAKDLGIIAIDSPCFRDEDEKEVARQSNEAQALGYEGKIALLPSHVPIINDCFAAT